MVRTFSNTWPRQPACFYPASNRRMHLDVCPLVLQEAMCAGVPVVSTDISAIPELVENGKQGLIVPPNDVRQLVVAMKTMLSDKELRTKMGQAGPEKIEQKFNIHKEVARLLSIWQKIANR